MCTSEVSPDSRGSVAYIYDEALHREINLHGENCWHLYLAEILDELGVRAQWLPPDSLTDLPPGVRVLLVGDLDASQLPAGTASCLRRWVEAGGILIGCMTHGLDEIFGLRADGPSVPTAPFSVGGWMSFNGKGEVAGILDPNLPHTLCPILSPLRRISCTHASMLTMMGLTSCALDLPAITCCELGRGRAYYFAFNLPQVIWTYHQGRPITDDYDGDGYLRSGDAIIVSGQPTASVPCADLLLLILENMMAPAGVFFVHQLPPLSGKVPDALFHYGGDDEACEGLQVKMSDIMHAFGLPYHLNVMLGRDGKFHFTDADRMLYEQRGHEFSLHFNFMHFPPGVKHPAPLDETEYQRQFHLFVAHYGKVPICTNTHWLRASGWADLARFGTRLGIRGDNSLVHHPTPPLDPVNLFGCPFGTVFPFFVYDDAAHGNARLEFVSIPIGFYEPGSCSHEPTHPLHGQNHFRPREYQRVVDLALRYGWTLNIFLHPTHMHSTQSRGREALQCMLSHIAARRARVLHTGTDALCLWWHARSQTECASVPQGWCVGTSHEAGILLRCLESALPPRVVFTLDGQVATAERRLRNGRPWLFIYVPPGKHTVRWSARGEGG